MTSSFLLDPLPSRLRSHDEFNSLEGDAFKSNPASSRASSADVNYLADPLDKVSFKPAELAAVFVNLKQAKTGTSMVEDLHHRHHHQKITTADDQIKSVSIATSHRALKAKAQLELKYQIVGALQRHKVGATKLTLPASAPASPLSQNSQSSQNNFRTAHPVLGPNSPLAHSSYPTARQKPASPLSSPQIRPGSPLVYHLSRETSPSSPTSRTSYKDYANLETYNPLQTIRNRRFKPHMASASNNSGFNHWLVTGPEMVADFGWRTRNYKLMRDRHGNPIYGENELRHRHPDDEFFMSRLHEKLADSDLSPPASFEDDHHAKLMSSANITSSHGSNSSMGSAALQKMPLLTPTSIESSKKSAPELAKRPPFLQKSSYGYSPQSLTSLSLPTSPLKMQHSYQSYNTQQQHSRTPSAQLIQTGTKKPASLHSNGKLQITTNVSDSTGTNDVLESSNRSNRSAGSNLTPSPPNSTREQASHKLSGKSSSAKSNSSTSAIDTSAASAAESRVHNERLLISSQYQKSFKYYDMKFLLQTLRFAHFPEIFKSSESSAGNIEEIPKELYQMSETVESEMTPAAQNDLNELRRELNAISTNLNQVKAPILDTMMQESDHVMREVSTTLTLEVRHLNDRVTKLEVEQPSIRRVRHMLYTALEYLVLFIFWSVWGLASTLSIFRKCLAMIIRAIRWLLWC